MGLINSIQQIQVSEQRRLPVDNVGTDKLVNITGETVQLKFYNASDVLTNDAGQAAGTVVVGKLAHRNVKNALGDVTGTFKDTSLSFTSTALTNEKAFPYLIAETNDDATGVAKAEAITSGFVNGEYCVDYRTGTIYGLKVSATTTLTSTAYTVETATSTSPGGIASDININEVAGTSTASGAGAVDAGTLRTTLASDDPAVTSLGIMDDWDNAASDGASVSGDVAHDDVDAGEPIKIGGKASQSTPNAVADGDRVDAYFDEEGFQQVETKGYDPGADAMKYFNTADLSTKYLNESLVDTTNESAGTEHYPSDKGGVMDGYADLSFSGKFIDADGTVTMTVEMTNDEDATNADWIQVYSYDDKNNTTTNSWTITNGTLTFANSFSNANYKRYRVKVVYSGSTNTAIIKSRKRAL